MKMSDLAKLLGDAYQNLDSFPAEKQKEEKEHQMTTVLQEGLGLTEKKGYELEAELEAE